ncbi:MAG: UDP-N-acetylmuramoyl-L-alanine--D-glutamate ligase [Rickettsiales bacterium]|jgi:UDP-N-acetylmuramoylalanine--D-glutamate ligase|nr:UDP-N-acetylmuramoyl-L-alanine--D-glutamate ligase [Rickettsiales bacterium]
MIIVSEYRGQAVGVFGLGKAGSATVASLMAGGAEVFAWDDKGASGENCIHFHEWPWQKIKALILAPGVPLTHPAPHPVVMLAHEHGVPVIGDIELLYRAQPAARYVAITGTNGKSTTTALIHHILKEAGKNVQVGGNIGTAALTLEPLGEDGIYVLETSSYQLDLLRTTRFNVAVFLNITPDHLDRHGSMENYVAAKCHIFDRQREGDVAVVAVDDEWTSRLQASGRFQESALIPVSSVRMLEHGVYVRDGVLYDHYFPEAKTLRPESLLAITSLTGRHNWQNAAAAYAACRSCGAQPATIHDAMKRFPGLKHRLQLVAEIDGVRFINDSKATNADATSNALAPYGDIYWILGGKPKEGGIVSLAEYFPKIRHAFLIGQAAEEFAKTLEGKVSYTHSGTLDAATKQAAALAWREKRHGSVVLLSPACASFDQWKSFEERGDAFCGYVEALNAS